MYKTPKREQTLCSNNLSVKDNLTRLRALIKKEGVENPEIYELIHDSRETLRIMKWQGQHMENRLKKYVGAINSLGFTRKESKKRRYSK